MMTLKYLRSKTMIQWLKHWFNVFGYQQVLQFDIRLQFQGQFAKFCLDYEIQHKVSWPFNSQSNRHAEASVKNVKGFTIMVSTSRFDNMFFAW